MHLIAISNYISKILISNQQDIPSSLANSRFKGISTLLIFTSNFKLKVCLTVKTSCSGYRQIPGKKHMVIVVVNGVYLVKFFQNIPFLGTNLTNYISSESVSGSSSKLAFYIMSVPSIIPLWDLYSNFTNTTHSCNTWSSLLISLCVLP